MLKPTTLAVWCWWCMTVCSQCTCTLDGSGVTNDGACIAIHYSRKYWWGDAPPQPGKACPTVWAGRAGALILIWSEAKNWIRSSHSQGFQQKDSPYTISGFPHACVVSLGTIFWSILFLGKERICIHIYTTSYSPSSSLMCTIMYVV
jgi:hypothetical protein